MIEVAETSATYHDILRDRDNYQKTNKDDVYGVAEDKAPNKTRTMEAADIRMSKQQSYGKIVV